MNSSATFERHGVSEIGLSSFSNIFTRFFFCKGATSAIFQAVRIDCSKKDKLRIFMTGRAIVYEYSTLSSVTFKNSGESSSGRRSRGVEVFLQWR